LPVNFRDLSRSGIPALAGLLVIFLVAACARTRQQAVLPPVPASSAPVPATPPPPVAPPLPLQSANSANHSLYSTPSVYVPDVSHSGQPLPDGILAWDASLKSTNVTVDVPKAHFEFTFTNVTSGPVTVLNVHPSCGCTTAELPPTPWLIPAGGTGLIRLNVAIHGTGGTLFKSVTVTTDKGTKMLTLRINLLPAPVVKLTDDEMLAGIMAARVDRQAVFRGKCADCHNHDLAGKYDRELFQSACAICHEAEHRATMVPDLSQLKVPTNAEFWRVWISGGKPGSLMPAFDQSQGGPLNDMQIASLARYLNVIYPSKTPLPPANP
jgi:mono/diheme cytochrome c family protein